jgi:hypothetical protein
VDDSELQLRGDSHDDLQEHIQCCSINSSKCESVGGSNRFSHCDPFDNAWLTNGLAITTTYSLAVSLTNCATYYTNAVSFGRSFYCKTIRHTFGCPDDSYDAAYIGSNACSGCDG